jgi:sugar (pentulose or hexulose) kinase
VEGSREHVTQSDGRSLLLVGVDVGTTLTKAGIVDANGQEIVRAAVPTVWQPTATGAETSGDVLLASVVEVLGEVMAVAPGGSIVAVGVTSMAETVVLLDKAGNTVGPAIAWHDTRASLEHEAYRRDFGPQAIGYCTGLGTSQIPTIASLRWLTRNVEETRRAVRALSVAEWIAYCLGGEQAAEASLASRTGAFAVASRTWWGEALEWASVPTSLFPPVRQAGTPFGRIRAVLPGCARLQGAVVTVAGHDHLCGAIGIGAVDSSQVMDSCGTAEALVRAVPVSPGRDLSAGLERGLEIG